MDLEWFKERKRELKLTDAVIAEAIGRDRSIANKLLSGRLPFDVKYATGLAKSLKVDRATILHRAGITDEPQARPAAQTAATVEMVGIHFSDADFGLGSVFADEAPNIELLQFPKPWVESITYTSPALLSWVRARGSSMKPTINDGDMILLDHSQRKVEDQDDIWAFTVGDTRAIKRLRVKADRYQIFSDNPAVPDDEEPIDFVNIVGRVIFVGSRT